MNTPVSQPQKLTRIITTDAALIVVATFIPTLSHLTYLPLYQLNPMLALLMISMLVIKYRRNAMLLAVLLPWISCLATGMPTPIKAFCMSAEFLSVTAVFSLAEKKSESRNIFSTFGIALLSILAGKCAFYTLKALLAGTSGLVSTPILMQILSCFAIAMSFAILSNLNTGKNGR